MKARLNFNLPQHDLQTKYSVIHQQLPIGGRHERYEAKIKTLALLGTPWSKIPATHTFHCDPSALAGFVAGLMGDDVHEIRTNQAGSLQGDYWPHPRRLAIFTNVTPGPPLTRPATPDDYCYECGAQIGGDVTEVAISHFEIHFVCQFCTLDPDVPLPFALTELGEIEFIFNNVNHWLAALTNGGERC